MVIWYFFMHKTPEFNNVNNALMIFIITSLKKIWSFDNIWIEIIKVLTFQSNYLKTKFLLTIWIYTQFHVVNIFFCHLTFRVYIEINWSAQYKNWQIVPFYQYTNIESIDYYLPNNFYSKALASSKLPLPPLRFRSTDQLIKN